MDQPIDAAPETTAAIVGRALRGPLNTPVLVRNFGEFRKRFGESWSRSSLGPAVRDFFDHGGRNLYVVRVANNARGAMICLPASGFADDTVLTVVTAQALLDDGDYAGACRRYGRACSDAGCDPHPSRGHQRGSATALAVFLARSGAGKANIKSEIEERFGYDLTFSLDAIRPAYRFDTSCQGSVPEPPIAVLKSTDYESAVRNAVSPGGDADAMACIAGGIAQAFYEAVSAQFAREVRSRLPEGFLDVLARFEECYGSANRNPTIA